MKESDEMIIFGSIVATIFAYIISAVLAVAVVLPASRGTNRSGQKLEIITAWALMFFFFLLVSGLVSLKLFPHALAT